MHPENSINVELEEIDKAEKGKAGEEQSSATKPEVGVSESTKLDQVGGNVGSSKNAEFVDRSLTAGGGDVEIANMDEVGLGSADTIRQNEDGDGDSASKENIEYQNELVHFATIGTRLDNDVIHFDQLARVNILHLQDELQHISSKHEILEMSTRPGFPLERSGALDLKQLEVTLHRYTDAIRDYEYLVGMEDGTYAGLLQSITSFRPFGDALHLALSQRHIISKKLPKKSFYSDPLRRVLKKVLPKSLAWAEGEKVARPVEYWNSDNTPAPRMVSPFVDALARFIVALTGGLSLIVPMLIMRIHQNPDKSLIITSIAVVLFSGVVSVGFKASNAETLGITAAYAAVLVVFVGTSA